LLAELALQTRSDPKIVFVFCGNGAGREGLMARCASLPNVHFLDLQPVDRLGELLGLADVHLLPQRADAADLVMPSKLTGMLSSGRPVLAGARPETELGQVVAQCGRIVPPEDATAFAAALQALAADAPLRRTLGERARRFAEEHVARDSVLARFERDLLDCIALPPR
jgi:colanic acid biosynthesis glycosyl transferase WcaI